MACVIDGDYFLQARMDVDIVNYGPIPIKLEVDKRNLPSPKIFSFNLCGRLAPGETGKVEVTFSPNSQTFTKLEETYEKFFNIAVCVSVAIS